MRSRRAHPSPGPCTMCAENMDSHAAGLTIDLDQGLEELGLEKRLRDTPPTAHIRGLFFKLAEQAVADHSSELLAVWRAAAGARSRWAFRMYSTRDFMREQAVAAVLLDPAAPGAALRRMWATTPRLSGLIRAEGFIRYLAGNNPMAALTWLERNRPMMCDYGDWWVTPAGLNAATLHFQDEYTWIEYCHVGGVEGTLRRCGVSPTVTAELAAPYRGMLRISWT